MEIVYCGGCGRLLREDDFERGQARFLDNRPWCSDCKPPQKDPIPSAPASPRRQGSSAKHPRVSAGGTRRGPGPRASSTALVGLGVALLALGALGIVFFSGGAPEPAPVTVPGPTEPPRRTPDYSETERLLKDLETFASLAPPDKILSRCEELASRFRGAPQEKRFREIEAAARESKRGREQEGQLTHELDAIRKLMEEDPRYLRYDEIVRRLKAAREIAGSRTPEIDRRLADYQKERQDAPSEKHAGPFSEDEQGFIRNWLVLGVFPNENDRGIDTDFLKSEETHEPVADLAVGKLKWGVHRSAEAKVDFFKVAHLKIKKPKDNVVAYAACLVQTSESVASEIRMGSDDGGALWVDGRLVGKAHRKRALVIDEDRYPVPLSPGVHRILVKVENHGGDFEFLLRILSAEGKAIPGLKIWN